MVNALDFLTGALVVEVVLVLVLVLVLKVEVLVEVIDVDGNGVVVVIVEGTVRLELVNGSSGVVVSH